MTDSTPPIDAPPDQEAAGAPPPRLKLEIDEPLLRLIRFVRSVGAQAGGASRTENQEDVKPPEPAKKGRLRPRTVAVRSLQLGRRKIAGTDGLDIVAKFLYNKPRKIVCQMRRGDALVKIDILWSKIRALSACFDDARFDTLRIEVKSSSEQYRADRPPPRMHIQWRPCANLTTRTFCLQFDTGTLERSYGKMLYTDPSLMLLMLPPPPPPGGAADAQQTGIITAAAPVPPSVDAEEEMPSTRMVGSTNTGANVATHQYSGTQSNNDPSQPAHMHPSSYRYM